MFRATVIYKCHPKNNCRLIATSNGKTLNKFYLNILEDHNTYPIET